MANVKITELDFASTPLAGSELIEIVQGGVNKKVEVNEVGGGGGSSTPTTFGTITKSGLAFTFSTGFSWLFNGVENANTTSITRTLTAATDNYKRIDVAYGNGSNNILIQQGVEALDVALKPNIPTNCVEICSFNVYGGVVFIGGGVTEFIELTDVPASYTGQGSKVVAVKVDESGLEFVAGGGGTTPTLQEVLDEGKTATFTDPQDALTEINLGEYNEMDLESPIFFRQSRTFEDVEQIHTFLQKLGTTLIQSSSFDVVTEIGKVSSFALNNGNFIAQKQNQYPTKTANQNIELEDIAEVDISGTELDVIFKPKPKFISGTYYLVDEDYVANAIAGVTTPDATPTVKGIAKLYTSLGSNTDGAVDQNTVNSALSAKANAPLIDTVSSSALTGVTTEGILKSYLIEAGTYSASEILNFANDLYKTGTAGTVTSRLYTNTTNSLSGASLLAVNISTSGSRKIALRRQLVLKDGNIETLATTATVPDDNVNSGTVATIVTFNPAVDNYFITTAQNASTGDSTIQNNFKIHF